MDANQVEVGRYAKEFGKLRATQIKFSGRSDERSVRKLQGVSDRLDAMYHQLRDNPDGKPEMDYIFSLSIEMLRKNGRNVQSQLLALLDSSLESQKIPHWANAYRGRIHRVGQLVTCSPLDIYCGYNETAQFEKKINDMDRSLQTLGLAMEMDISYELPEVPIPQDLLDKRLDTLASPVNSEPFPWDPQRGYKYLGDLVTCTREQVNALVGYTTGFYGSIPHIDCIEEHLADWGLTLGMKFPYSGPSEEVLSSGEVALKPAMNDK